MHHHIFGGGFVLAVFLMGLVALIILGEQRK